MKPIPTGKIIQANYDYWQSLSEERKCYALSDREIYLILSQIEYLSWTTRWQSPTNQEISKDEIETVADNLADTLLEESTNCMTTTEPCCPEQLTGLQNIYNLILGQADTGTATSFAPDAPENYNGNSGETGQALADRNAALCSAVICYVIDVLRVAYTLAVGVGIAAAAVLAITAVLAPPVALTIAASLAVAGAVLTADIMDNTDAIRNVCCVMYAALKGQETNAENFRNSLNGSGFLDSADEQVIRNVVHVSNQLPENYRAFVSKLAGFYYAASAVGADDTACICCSTTAAPIIYAKMGKLTQVSEGHYIGTSATETNGNHQLDVRSLGEDCCFCVVSVDKEQPFDYANDEITDCGGATYGNTAVVSGQCLRGFRMFSYDGYGHPGNFTVEFEVCTAGCDGSTSPCTDDCE